MARVAAATREHGRDVAQLDGAFLARCLDRRREVTATPTLEAYVARLERDGIEAEAFFSSLDIHHSELFRAPLVFALLEERILPGLVRRAESTGGAEIRVWSAGCAAGQEAYSVAILLAELAEASATPIRFRVIATDTSMAQVELARAGSYSELSMRNVRLCHLRRWFETGGSGWTVTAGLRALVDFSVHDLLDPRSASPPASIFGWFDLVLCSNVLFYYRPDVQHRILDRLRASLSVDGILATGEAEREPVLESGGFQAMAHRVPLFTRRR